MDVILDPQDDFVLYDQASHISSQIWRGIERHNLETIENVKGIRQFILRENQKELLRAMGFGAFTDPANWRNHDNSLISALVERWRSETNSFHFGVGEMTITLEDVGFIFGLPVMGKPVTWGKHPTMKQLAIKKFGFEIPANEFGHGGVKLRWLRETFGQLLDDHTDEDLWLYTKAYLWYILGAILFPTRTKNTVHCKYLLFLENINEIHSYAWGAAVLAYLYRSLHKATRINCKAIYGCLTLLQVWAYERIPVGRPNPKPKSVKVLPRVKAWMTYKKLCGKGRDDPHHHQLVYRGKLEIMHADDVTWQPYSRFEESVWQWNNIPIDFIVAGLAHTPLIHFEVIEYQMPDRVMRQFNCLQSIPQPAVDMRPLRIEPCKSFEVKDASVTCAPHIELWNRWQDTLEALVSEASPVISIDVYNMWYTTITRTRMLPPLVGHGKRYQLIEIIDQQRALNLLENAKSIFDQLSGFQWFKDNVPPEIRTSIQSWDVDYGNFMSTYTGKRAEGSTWGQSVPEVEPEH